MGCAHSHSSQNEKSSSLLAADNKVDRERRRLTVLKGHRKSDSAERADQKSAEKVETLLELLPRGDKRLSLFGQQAAQPQMGFENKALSIACQNLVKEAIGERCGSELGVGFACKKGLKPESPNQDDFCVMQVDRCFGFYGVFDGHGPHGHDLSNFVHQYLPLVALRAGLADGGNPCDILKKAFLKTQSQCVRCHENGKFDSMLSGTTATVCVVDERRGWLYAAWVGDSRAVIGMVSDESTGQLSARELTHDHKPNSEGEKQRIEAAGGQVRCLQGDINNRVFVKGKLYPGLAMSRSMGDLIGAAAGVSAEPDVIRYPIQPNHKFIMLCSDGVWEFISNEEAVQLVSTFPPERAMEAAEALAQEAWARWIAEEGGGVVDDITVIIVHLHQNQTTPTDAPPPGTTSDSSGESEEGSSTTSPRPSPGSRAVGHARLRPASHPNNPKTVLPDQVPDQEADPATKAA